jgi:hypothetical protein
MSYNKIRSPKGTIEAGLKIEAARIRRLERSARNLKITVGGYEYDKFKTKWAELDKQRQKDQEAFRVRVIGENWKKDMVAKANTK